MILLTKANQNCCLEGRPLTLKRIAGLSVLETIKRVQSAKICDSEIGRAKLNEFYSSLPRELYYFLLNNASEI